MNSSRLWLPIGLLAVLLSFACAPSSGDNEFSADLVERGLRGKVYVKGERRRIENPRFPQEFIVRDDTTKRFRLFNTTAKEYFEIPADDVRCGRSDFIYAAARVSREYEVTAAGTEEIEGRLCDKTVVSVEGREAMRVWTARDLNLAIKTVQPLGSEERSSELQNIVLGPVPDALFEIPDGYRRIEDPMKVAERQRADLEAREAALPELDHEAADTSPCRTLMKSGGFLRVSVDATRPVKVQVVNRNEDPAECLVLPFYRGKQVESIPTSLWTLANRGVPRTVDYNLRLDPDVDPPPVDEVRIEAYRGSMVTGVEQRGELQKDFVNPGGMLNGVDLLPDRDLEIRLTGENPFREVTRGKYLLLFADPARAPEVKEFSLQNGETQTWSYPASTGIRRVNFDIARAAGGIRITTLQSDL